MAYKFFEIPLEPSAQFFNISLAGVSYQMSVYWNSVVEHWMLDIADQAGVKLISGVPLVCGVDLLGQHQHLGLGGSLVITSDGQSEDPPDFSNLGVTSHLIFAVDDEAGVALATAPTTPVDV